MSSPQVQAYPHAERPLASPAVRPVTPLSAAGAPTATPRHRLPRRSTIVAIGGREITWTPGETYEDRGHLDADERTCVAFARAVELRAWAPVAGVLVQANERDEIGVLAALTSISSEQPRLIAAPRDLIAWILDARQASERRTADEA